MSKRIYIETLLSMGGKKKNDSIEFITKDLLIRDKATRVEYTVVKVYPDENKKPVVLCYRYYMPDKHNRKIYIKIPHTDFDMYEPV